ncbi:glycoside hydrolase family 26 protein [Lentibacillus sediminis]|uniref:glycoside hydrolase family 26 protein n=1 Tax=Lentibacillus sediminis TaxID=1940529 RepID=UPI00195C176F|nr:glycosyl hydrolase [Lentibacillus sediminis]
MLRNKAILIIVTSLLAIVTTGMVTFDPHNSTLLTSGENIKNSLANAASDFSKEIVFDGDHYKIDNNIFSMDGNIYIPLPDLTKIVPLEVKQNPGSLILTHQRKELTYKNNMIQNKESNDVEKFIIQNEIIYLPSIHLEKFLNLEIDYYFDKRTNTISIMSPHEQQKKPYNQNLGTTIFLHKENVPLAKYEPRGGIYLGGYVLQDEYINASMEKFNQLTGRKHASFFKYVGYEQPFPTEWVNEVVKAGGFPHIAWEPNDGLDAINDDNYLREFANAADAAKVPVLLRFASEMNGTWTAYSGKPELYIKKWKLVHDVMEEEAPNVMMLWNVFTMPEDTIQDFYPGDAYVDYVGVNIYNVVYHNNNIEERSDYENPLALLNYVYNTFSDTKPIVIGEFGATNYTTTDEMYHVDFAARKINLMYKNLPKLYPRVKFIYYFDVNNLVNAPEGRKINNYAITENKRLLNTYRSSIRKNDYLSRLKLNPSSDETFSYRNFLFYYNGELFVDIQFVDEYLNMNVIEAGEENYLVSLQGKSVEVTKEKLAIDKAAFFEKRDIDGVSIDNVLDEFNIEHFYNDGDLHIYQPGL